MQAAKHPREATLLATIFVLNAIEFLQAGMIAFSAGPIMGEIGATPEDFTIATAVYAVVAMGAIAKQAWLVERLGWRTFIQASVAVFVIGAAVCASSGGFAQYLVGRAVMGMGGAAFMTSARMMVNLMPPSPRRFIGIKSFASALAIGNALAPWLASEAVSHERWPAIFGLLAVLAVVAAALGSVWLPTARTPVEQRSGTHQLMLFTLLGGSFLGLYALQRATYDFYADALPLLAGVALAGAALLYFVHHQSGHARPLLALGRLAQGRYLMGLMLFTLCYIVLGANNYMLPALMQRALGFPWEVIGEVQSAGLMIALPGFWVMALVLARFPAPKKFYVAGFGALALFGVLLARLNGEANLWTDVMPAIGAYGVFIILVMATTAMQAFLSLQHDAQAFANGQQLKNMLSQFGIAFGVAAAALGLQWRGSEHYAVLNRHFDSADAIFNHSVGQLAEQLTAAGQGAQAGQLALVQLVQQMNQQATLLASLDYFRFVIGFAVVAALGMMVQRVLK
jgi:DHA2 family multidrug resistance protein